jgi:CTP:molybdopterin cytidylyltransferase MocA/HD superfamily phosphodiesterase
MQKSDIAVLIIAAGYSSRMNDFKPLLPLGKTSALQRLIETYNAHGLGHIYVVVGHRHEEIEEVLKDEHVTVVYNEAYDKGMFSSIQKGLGAIDEHVRAFYMNPVDIPLITVDSLECLFEAYVKEKKGVTYPTFLGRKGHPPLIDMKYKEHILSSDGEGGLKRVLEAFNEDAYYVSVSDQAVLMDMDTQEDYGTLCAYERRTAPTEKECLALMYENGVDEHIIAHCQAVEKMVQIILLELSCANVLLDEDALLSAALLHDIARKEKNHADVGALKLKAMGYEAIGTIIATHMDIEVNVNAPLNENELLFLADKLVSEDEACGFEKRFEKAFLKCAGNFDAQKNIMKRLNATKMIIKKIENLTGKVFHYG